MILTQAYTTIVQIIQIITNVYGVCLAMTFAYRMHFGRQILGVEYHILCIHFTW